MDLLLNIVGTAFLLTCCVLSWMIVRSSLKALYRAINASPYSCEDFVIRGACTCGRMCERQFAAIPEAKWRD